MELKPQRQVADLREFAKSQNWEVMFELDEDIQIGLF